VGLNLCRSRHLRTRDGVGMPHARSGGDALRLCGMPMYMARLCQHIPSLIHVGYKLNSSVFERASVLGMTAVGWVAKIL
jgi:hypothetical protein